MQRRSLAQFSLKSKRQCMQPISLAPAKRLSRRPPFVHIVGRTADRHDRATKRTRDAACRRIFNRSDAAAWVALPRRTNSPRRTHATFGCLTRHFRCGNHLRNI
jgi:hypothetical protein